MSQQLDALTAQVAASNNVAAAAVTLLNGLKAQLDTAIASADQDDGDALQALSDSLGAETTALAAAITDNTPIATSPTAAPPGVTATPVPPVPAVN